MLMKASCGHFHLFFLQSPTFHLGMLTTEKKSHLKTVGVEMAME